MKTSKRFICLLLLFILCFAVGCGGTKDDPKSSAPGEITNTPDAATQSPTQIPTENPTVTPSQTPDYTNKKIIALTFDDGPHANTQKVLDVLAKHNVKATFFVVGRALTVEANQEMLRKTAAAGHEIANHSYSHSYMTTLSDNEFMDQINQTNTLIQQITGQTPKLFRPPMGYYTTQHLSISPLSFVLWYIDSWDWYRISDAEVKNYAQTHQCTEDESIDIISDQMLYEHGLGYQDVPAGPITERLTHGSIILFHDVHAGTAVVIDKLLTYMEQSGEYVVLPVTEMMTTLETGPIPGKLYRNAWPLK